MPLDDRFVTIVWLIESPLRLPLLELPRPLDRGDGILWLQFFLFRLSKNRSTASWIRDAIVRYSRAAIARNSASRCFLILIGIVSGFRFFFTATEYYSFRFDTRPILGDSWR